MSKIRGFIGTVVLAGSLLLFLSSCSTNPEQSSGDPPIPAGTFTELESLQNSFNIVSEQVLPSVVRIDVEEVRTQAAPQADNAPWFDFFFGEPDGDEAPRDREFRTQGLGSGVVVRREGDTYYVLTNAHVVGQADSIVITLDDGREYDGELVGSDERKDLALVELETNDELEVATFGDSSTLRVGDWVLAIGSPFGFQSTVTAGIVSALGRRGGPAGNISDFIQTDASINRGNSGGALVNLRGEVVGINTWITSQTGGSVGLGFSIPINNVVGAIDDFIELGSVRYGWLGVSIRSIPRELAEDLRLESTRGALVYHVFGGSPADEAGLLPGDFVTEINDIPVEDSDQLVLIVGDLLVDEIATFEIVRLGEERTVEVLIAERQNERVIAEQNQTLWPGLGVFPITPEIRIEAEIPSEVEGVIVSSLESRTPASGAGLRVGDIITRVEGRGLASAFEFYRELNDGGDQVALEVWRDGSTIELSIER
ncbi:MAG: Do family serine endopeptidase [Alkalispirochaetaceae bacterium]